MKNRLSPLVRVCAGLVVATVSLVGCSSSDSKDTGAATGTEAAVVETTAAATEADTVAAETTVAADTTADTAAPADTAAADTTVAAAADTVASAAGAADSKEALVTTLLSSMSGGAAADPADVACISGKLSAEDLTGFMGAAASGNSAGAVPGMKAIFACKPKALVASMKADTFDDPAIKVDDKQKDCIVDGLFEAIAANDEILAAMVSSSEPPAAFKESGRSIVKKCVPAGASRDALIKDIDKS